MQEYRVVVNLRESYDVQNSLQYFKTQVYFAKKEIADEIRVGFLKKKIRILEVCKLANSNSRNIFLVEIFQNHTNN